MAEAEVGDDVYGEDPTVNRLEAESARLTGKDAGLFVASGTMGNLASLLAHATRGQEVILGDEAHIFHYEAGSASALGGLVYHTVPTRADGTLPLEAIEDAIRPLGSDYYHNAGAGVICLENTHNRCGGTILRPDYCAEVASLAARHGLPIHLDGARIFNASVALGRPVTDWTRHATSMQFCLSKGLGAPVGSLIVGDAAFVDRARRVRKMLGGGMRQAGVLAAAGLVALRDMVGRLADDHANAKILAEGLAGMPGVAIDPSAVETNIVIFRLADAARASAFRDAAKREGVLLSVVGGGRLRAVTHDGITAGDCRAALDAMRRATRSG
jgi:threonine aldolase